MTKFRHVLLTGPPGVGKTTLTRKVCDALIVKDVKVSGFYTEEVRGAQGKRIGFDVVSLSPSGERRPLARMSSSGGQMTKGPMVGQYIVDVPSFESVALPALISSPQGGVVVVDEVGKMELFSSRFFPAVENVLQGNRGIAMLATVPVPRAKPMPAVERLKARQDAKLFFVDRTNRDDPALLEEILTILTGRP